MCESTTHSYTVTGMTCDHCRSSVLEEVAELDGVDSVEADLATGSLRVTGSAVSDEAIARTVEELGYKLAEAS
ncbi:MAG TPA: cation transporter [Solirubrobacterales bacterium]|nr:cation transporter [Solirubrobacterales bacterium]